MSSLKEKKEKKPSLLKEPFRIVRKTIRDRLTGNKPSIEDPKQPPTEQKSPLLHKNLSSDEVPMTETHFNRTYPGTSPPYRESQVKNSPDHAPNFVIKMSNGRMVDHPGIVKSHGEPSASPTKSAWSPSNSAAAGGGYYNGPYPRSGDRRPGYGAQPLPHYPSQWTAPDPEFDEPRRPVETVQQTATYESLLKEAQTLRRDLEKEHELNKGSKKDFENQIAETKLRIADSQRNKPSEQMYDEIIVSLSQELTDLEKKVKEIEARMHPLDRAIGDLRDVEDFITDRKLDSEDASMLFEEIMKKMFDDINISGHVFTGETPRAGLPKNVLEEMQGKMLTGTLNRSDPGQMGMETEGGAWVAFGDDYDMREKLTSTDTNYDETLRRKRNKDKFQRASMKLSDITEFTRSRMKSPGRTEAFRFHAFDRSDAVRDESYEPPQIESRPQPSLSVTSEHKSIDEVIRPIGLDSWMGFNQGTGTTPPPSELSESLAPSKSVADMLSLDHYPGLSPSTSVVEKENQTSELDFKTASADDGRLVSQKSTDTSNLQTVQVQTDETPDQNSTTELKPSSEEQKTTEKEKKPATEEEKAGGIADELAKVQLKKASDRPEPSTSGAPVDINDSDFALMAASVLAATVGESGKTGVKLDLDVKEAPAQPPKPPTKPPPPPPKKAAPPPPPPPPKKKGGPPPPPPGKKNGAKRGGPPPPPSGRRKGVDGLQRAPEVIAMFQEMRKALLGNAAKGAGGPKKIGGDAAAADPAALMEELSKNSKYAAQVQSDIQQYGPMIEDLIKEVSGFDAADMKEIIEFVKRVDTFLSELSDETAVLKQFEWPQRYYTMLEAKGLYEELEKMKKTFKNWQKSAKTRTDELKMIQKFMDKSKNRVDVVLRTKDADEKKFKESKIPWNAKIYTEVKVASLSTLVVYMEIVLEEVDAIMSAAPQEASASRSKALEKSMGHLTGAINFAFKAHQFAGGFTEACNAKFAEIASKTRELKADVASAAS